MLAWIPMSTEKSSPEKQAGVATDVLYRLTMAFPTWAGAILALYSIFLCRFSNLKMRLR